MKLIAVTAALLLTHALCVTAGLHLGKRASEARTAQLCRDARAARNDALAVFAVANQMRQASRRAEMRQQNEAAVQAALIRQRIRDRYTAHTTISTIAP